MEKSMTAEMISALVWGLRGFHVGACLMRTEV